MRKKSYITDNNILANEWDYDKNPEIDPKEISLGSHLKVWWKCGNGHSWQAAINNRAQGKA
ncbi:zinc-ribbon domain-containing protein [Butyrivibrio sp. VCB2006]|uniref:zinc-ribbon domain-containing protein n=1 Tax=Butyrivibrio sp. VCB2006 TaxID=1280679 RepID=UPI000492905C|nr:zinc-ribbon domain-containing protein [Butyrivibrio sp. VCB2006]